MTMKLSLCMQAITTLHPDDTDALGDKIAAYRTAGMDDRQSELSAVADLIAQAEARFKTLGGLLREQHPDLFVAANEPVKPETALPAAGSATVVAQQGAVSKNTIFTEDAASAARARLKAKLGRLSSGLDPETMMDGITLAGYHIEKGARTFAAFARAMVEDLGDAVKPYLQSWYMAVRSDPRAADFKADMDKASMVEDLTASDIDALMAEAAPAPQPAVAPTAMKAWGLATPATRRGMLNAAGYTDADQARALSGADWNQLTDPVRRALDKKATEPSAPAPQPTEALATQQAAPTIVEHTTAKGKVLRGVVRSDLTKEQAQAVDAYTFKKDGGWFIRERHIDDLIAAHPEGSTAPQTQTTEAAPSLTRHLLEKIKAGGMPASNLALKKIVTDFDEKPTTPARMKQAQEALETAIVMTAREVVARKEGPRSTFDALVRLYESQPLLNVRTSTSIEDQAYSTPAPLAFVASALAGVKKSSRVHEPTGGNGMLVIGADPSLAFVNEWNADRAASLREQGFDVTTQDASVATLITPGSADAVVTNPPFGSVKGEDGKPIKVKVDGYSIGQIDHLIAARALAGMKDDGRAVLILGANKIPGGMSNDDLVFFNWLRAHYRVSAQFEVAGDLYKRQGAEWPVRVVVIDGRGPSADRNPNAIVQRPSTWAEVYDEFSKALAAERPAATVVGSEPRGAGQQQPVPQPAGGQAARPDSGRPKSRTSGAGNVAGERPGTVGDRGAAAAEPMGERPGPQRPVEQPVADNVGRGGSGAAAVEPAGSARAAGLSSAENQFQARYVSRSANKDKGVLIPVNMAGPTQDALNRLEDEVGDIDQFLRKELGYASVSDMHKGLMGLQVDSIASAIFQIKAGKGVVIADQTGIGKGRQAAAVIRWAIRAGHIPVFITVKPSLFTDMYGDLSDIGSDDVSPFIMNVSESIKGRGDEKLFANTPATHRRTIDRIAATGQLPEGSNALFMTYSQINTPNAQSNAVMALAPRAVFILDESHNAGGDSNTGNLIKSVLDHSRGVTYLSATFAKRPDNMPVYFKTDIGEAMADDESLMGAMANGGLPLQVVVSNNLVRAGQMFRRERSYDGVSIETRADTTHRAAHIEMSDRVTSALRAIVAADRHFHENHVKDLQDEIKAQGERVLDIAGNQAKESVDHTQFSSVVHNFVRQMLLGLKAQAAADEAIASLKRGEKPLIAVENTMGSFLAQYARDNNILPGGDLGSFDYRNVLTRALDRTRFIVRQLPNGDKVKEEVPLADLSPATREMYDAAQELIGDLKLDIPVSPIDWMRQEITKAGFTVAEITGRSLSVDYSDPKRPTLDTISIDEQKDKVATTRAFNSGKLDAIILNVAGSTGISLHASEKFQDQRQRHMIVAQAAQDINIFMQMLGRIHRTGQVALPKYTILNADLPAEKRPTALLSGKMKSLNANTSSNTESATSVKTADMLNKYGDQIVNQFLADNFDLARGLGLDEEISEADAAEDIARKATGRLALMPVATQEAFYGEIEEQYAALMEYLNKTNQNDLEPRTFDFAAKELRQEVLFEGPNKASPFGEDAIYGEYSIKAQGRAMTPDEIRLLMNEHLGGKNPSQHVQGLIDTLKPTFQKWYAGLDEGNKLIANNVSQKAVDFLQSHAIGATYRVEINGDVYNAVITNLRNTHKATGNPFSLSKIQVTAALNGALRSITTAATQFSKIEVANLHVDATRDNISSMFEAQPANQRETAKIVTGNLLGAYGELGGTRGTIITFTKEDGSDEQGILLPKKFNFAKDVRHDYRLQSAADALKFLSESTNGDLARFGIMSRDSLIRAIPNRRGVTIQVPKSKAKGGRFFLDDALREQLGDFVSTGNQMRASTDDPARAERALAIVLKKQALYAVPSMADEARAIVGDKQDAARPGAEPQLSRPAPFYSALAKTIEASPMNAGAAGAWKQALKGMVSAGKVKADEVAWTGIEEWMDLQPGKITKAQIAEFLKNDGAAGLPLFKRSGMGPGQMTTLAKTLAAGLKSDITVLASPFDLTGTERRQMLRLDPNGMAEGVFFPDTGRTYLFSNNVHSAAAAVRVTLHESFHRGLHVVMGEEGAAMLRRIHATNKRVRDLAAAQMKAHGIDQLTAINEALAELAGSGEATRLNLWQQLVRMVREFVTGLAKLAGVEMEWTDARVLDLVARMTRAGLRGEPSVSMGGEMAAAHLQRAWHGTPYRGIEKFDTSKIGTGEGAQAYGYGLYFASKREVADYYRTQLSASLRGWNYAKEATDRGITNYEDMRFAFHSHANGQAPSSLAARRIQNASIAARAVDAGKLADMVEAFRRDKEGQLYEVEIPEDSEMLMWDKSLSEQPAKVREALAPFIERHIANQRDLMRAFPAAEVEREINAGLKTINGQGIYEQAGYMEGGGDRSASEYLSSLGIKGIKYLDGMSRDGASGSHNYVIFSGDDAAIVGAQLSRAPDKTKTEAFKGWFGRSKITNADGSPKVMYHGTGADITSFRAKQAGAIFVTDEPIFAQAYANASTKWLNDRGQAGGENILPVYVKAENPFDYDNPKHVDALVDRVFKQAQTYTQGDGNKALVLEGKKTLYTPDVLRYALTEGQWSLIEMPEIQAAIKAAGHDSFYVNEGDFKNLAVYESTQVKSAIGNNGAFDPANPNILLSRPSIEQREATDLINAATDEGALTTTGEKQKIVGSYKGRVERVLKRVDHTINGLGELPDSEQFLAQRYRALGRIAEVDKVAGGVRDVFGKATREDKAAIYAYLTDRDGDPATIRADRVREVAVGVKQYINKVGDALVERGLLSEESREEYRDRYLPRMYLAHLLNEGDWRAIGAGKKVSDMGYLKQRKDIPQEIRDVLLGEVKDPTFLAATALAKPMRDMALLDWLEQISQNQAWIFPKSLVKWNDRKVSAFWLKAEADALRHRARLYPEEVNRDKAMAVAEQMDVTAAEALNGLDLNHKDYRQIPNTARYGRLRGMLVRREIYDDLMGAQDFMPKDPGWAEQVLGYGGYGTKLTQVWKMSKVSLNIPGQIRNAVSNAVLLQLSGVPLHKMPILMARALSQVRNGGVHWKVAQKYGVTESTFQAQEMFRARRDLLELEREMKGMTPWVAIKSLGAAVADMAGDAYQFTEAIFKTVKIMDGMEREGLSEEAAAIEAQKWLFDYSLLDKNIRYLRNAPVGAPFVTFTTKVLPRLAETALLHPQRFLPWVALMYGAQMWAQAMFGGDDDEWERLKKALPKWMQEKGHIAFLPWRDDAGRLQALDMSYFLPWSQWAELAHNVGNADFAGAMRNLGIFGGPVTEIITALKTGKDSFTKRDIVNEGDPPAAQAKAYIAYAWDLMMPPMMASTGVVSPMWLLGPEYGGKLAQATTGSTNRYGDERATFGQAASRLFGANVYGIDPTVTREQNLVQMKADTLKVQTRLRSKLRDRGVTPERAAQIIKEYNEETQARAKKLAEYEAVSRVPEFAKKVRERQ